MPESHRSSANDVFAEELRDIVTRRRIAGGAEADSQPPEQTKTGLALSGGGVRSASFGLGILQAFYRRGVLKYFDYLSGVSGGGYTVAFFSSLIHTTKGPIDWTPGSSQDPKASDGVMRSSGDAASQFDLISSSGPQPKRIQSLGQRMTRFGRPLLFLNRHLWGLITTNVLMLSGIAAIAAIAAFVMRMADQGTRRLYLAELGFLSDIGLAMFPATVLFALWLSIYLVSAGLGARRAMQRVTSVLLAMTLIAALLGVGSILTSGDIDVSWTQKVFHLPEGASKFIDQLINGATTVLAALFATSLLPYLNFSRLVRSGTNSSKPYEGWIFGAVSRILIFGTPFLVYCILASENISGWKSSRPDRNAFISVSVADWLEFSRQVEREAHAPLERDLLSLLGFEQKDFSRIICDATLDHHNDPIDGLVDPTNAIPLHAHIHPITRIAILNDRILDRDRQTWFWQRWARFAASPLTDTYKNCLADRLQQKRLCEWVADRIDRRVLANPRLYAICNIEPSISILSKDDSVLSKDDPLSKDKQSQRSEQFKKRGDELWFRADSWQKRQPTSGILDWAVFRLSWSSNPGEAMCDILQRERMRHADDETLQADMTTWGARLAAESTTLEEGEIAELERLLHDIRDFNMSLLEAHYRKAVKGDQIRNPETTTFAAVVQAKDQRYRLQIAGWAALAFVILGLGVNLNATSLHGFYRDQLSMIWNVGGPDLPLGSLSPWDKGGPIPLWTGTVNHFDRRSDSERDRPSLFLFSPRYVGSRRLGYTKTAAFREGRHSLADTMAISGAALTPAVGRNLLLRTFLVLTNFRMGQWLPTPSHPGSRRAILLRLLWDWLTLQPKQRSLCFVTDGGHTENCGVAPLLQRKCQLIVAVDASFDPDGQFLDLARLLRTSESRYGIRFSSTASDDKPVDLTPIRSIDGKSPAHVVLARIHYPADSEDGPASKPRQGLLIYIKPSFTGDESADLLLYRQDKKEFPHDSTIDQFFEPERFDAYRQLGEHIGDAVWRELWRKTTWKSNGTPIHSTVNLWDLNQWEEKKASFDSDTEQEARHEMPGLHQILVVLQEELVDADSTDRDHAARILALIRAATPLLENVIADERSRSDWLDHEEPAVAALPALLDEWLADSSLSPTEKSAIRKFKTALARLTQSAATSPSK